jgi:dynein intermediate chain 1, axonemal
MSFFTQDAFTQTNPPPHINFSASVTQWGIYDAYLEEHSEQEKEKREKREKEKNTAAPLGPQKKEEPPKKDSAVVAKSVVAQPTQGLAAKILERMSNQNTYDEVIHGLNKVNFIETAY